jgi:hypothetical protein
LSICLVQVLVGLFLALRPLVANRCIFFGSCAFGAVVMGQCIYDVAKASLADPEKRHRAIVGILPTFVSIAITVGLMLRDPAAVANSWFIIAAGLILSYRASPPAQPAVAVQPAHHPLLGR